MKTSQTPRSDSQLTVLVMSPPSASTGDTAPGTLYNNTRPEELDRLRALLFPPGTTLLMSKGPLSLTVIETSCWERQLRVLMSKLGEAGKSRVLEIWIEELRRYFGIGSKMVRAADAGALRLGRLDFIDYIGSYRR